MYCSTCGENNPASKEFCFACGSKVNMSQEFDFNVRQLQAAETRLKSQQWPAYGFHWGLGIGFAAVLIFSEGWVWGGWAPPWIYEWLTFFSSWAFVLGTAYGIGYLIDDSRLGDIKKGETVRLTSWRFVICIAAGLMFAYWLMGTSPL